MIGERIIVLLNSTVRGFDVGRLERRLSYDQGVNDDAQRPDIDFIRVARLSFEHFRCDVVRRTADSSFLLTIEVELGGEAEIAELDLHFVVEEEVTQLQISMDDAMTVEVLDSGADLVDIALDLELVQSLTSAQKLVK